MTHLGAEQEHETLQLGQDITKEYQDILKISLKLGYQRYMAETWQVHLCQLQRWKKTTFFYTSKFLAKTILPEKCVNCNKGEFAAKQRKMYFTKSVGKKRLPHIYRRNNFEINNKFFLFLKKKFTIYQRKRRKYHPTMCKIVTFC